MYNETEQAETYEEPAAEMPELALDGGAKKLIQFLVENEEIDDSIKDEYWGFFNKEAALTWLDTAELVGILSEYDDTVIAGKMSKFPGEFTGKQLQDITQGRTMAKLKLTRSRGRGDKNERTMQATQISQQIFEEGESPSGGIISKAKKAFGMGGRQ